MKSTKRRGVVSLKAMCCTVDAVCAVGIFRTSGGGGIFVPLKVKYAARV
jgi:hypothetical protein